MPTAKEILGGLLKVEGLKAAIVVGRDGFAIESVTTMGMDVDALSAVLSTSVGPSEVLGNDLNVGDLVQNMIEYKSGNIILTTLGSNAILGVVADPKANLGVLRYNIKKISDQLLRVL